MAGQQARRRRRRSWWVSAFAPFGAAVLAVGLMSLADGAENKLQPPVRVVQFGAGPPVDHQGLGNALTPANLEPPRPAPLTPTPTTVASTPVTALAVARKPATPTVVTTVPLPPTTTPPTTVPVVTKSDDHDGLDAVAIANAERHHPQRFRHGSHRNHAKKQHKKHAPHVKHQKAPRHSNTRDDS